MKEVGIVVDTLASRVLFDELKAPGEVRADAYSTMLVSPRVEAQVLERKARLGDLVKAGQPLVLLSSVQVAETQGALIVAEQDWQRIAALGPQAVSARRYNEAKVQRDQARAKLRAYGLAEGQIAALLRKGSAGADGSFELLAPTAGRITTDEFL
ncbi:efflux RND transporter periplasmic adaptor subunit, partial [Xanthomonas euvesicatoria]|uniref:efflux RND transporter periplasmic adaptor subunit n=1 Tax=Xanthomonas euvesicatoria TaxID=456327 RepID=UPI001F49AF43